MKEKLNFASEATGAKAQAAKEERNRKVKYEIGKIREAAQASGPLGKAAGEPVDDRETFYRLTALIARAFCLLFPSCFPLPSARFPHPFRGAIEAVLCSRPWGSPLLLPLLCLICLLLYIPSVYLPNYIPIFQLICLSDYLSMAIYLSIYISFIRMYVSGFVCLSICQCMCVCLSIVSI